MSILFVISQMKMTSLKGTDALNDNCIFFFILDLYRSVPGQIS